MDSKLSRDMMGPAQQKDHDMKVICTIGVWIEKQREILS